MGLFVLTDRRKLSKTSLKSLKGIVREGSWPSTRFLDSCDILWVRREVLVVICLPPIFVGTINGDGSK